jgi:hypothetical protein
MTPNELTDILALELGAVNDFTFKRAILSRANATRDQQLKRSLEKTPQDRKFFTQAIQVAMENYNSIEGTDLVCTYSRSICDTPRPLRANSTVYDYVGSVDGTNAFRYTTIGASHFLKAGNYTHKTYFYHTSPSRIIVEQGGIARILIVGIFDDPEVAYNLDAKTRECVNCDFWESQYPCSGDILDIIIQEITGKWRTKPVNLEVNGTQNRPDPTT